MVVIKSPISPHHRLDGGKGDRPKEMRTPVLLSHPWPCSKQQLIVCCPSASTYGLGLSILSAFKILRLLPSNTLHTESTCKSKHIWDSASFLHHHHPI